MHYPRDRLPARRRAREGTVVELTDNLLWLLKQALHFSLSTVNESVKPHGVSTSHLGVLRQLAQEPGLSGAELARRLLITPQGVQLALTALESRGLVERRQDPGHGRILRAHLTADGCRVAEAVFADAVAAHQRVFGVLSTDEQEQLRALLARVIEQGTGHTVQQDHI